MRWVVVAVLVVAIGIVTWRIARTEDRPPPRPTAVRSGKIILDVGAFTRLRDARLERARGLAKSHGPRQRVGSGSGLAGISITSEVAGRYCILGPAALCDSLAEMLADCDAGDATTCLAIGQFLADTPPRALMAILFFAKACDLGDREACVYQEMLRGGAAQRCDEDSFACGWRATRTMDLAVLDEACTHGVGDACAFASFIGGDQANDLAKSQAYLEKACQLGLPMACQGLADRLSPDCEPKRFTSEDGKDTWSVCYAIDEALAEQARVIGCEAGWGNGCTYSP